MNDGALNKRNCLSIILAAGEGTRMRSRMPKVLHQLAGRSMVAHVLTAVRDAGGTATAVVVGPGHGAVEKEAKVIVPDAEVFVQEDRLGTAHAVLAARKAIERGCDDIVIAFGDTPLIKPETLRRMRAAVAEGAAVVVLGFRPADPTGYGRLLMEGAQLVGIREERDASESERASPLGNAGLMALDGRHALALLEKIDSRNVKNEFYLTDIVTLARQEGHAAVVIEAEEDEVRGINTKTQLSEAEAVVQQRLRQAALEAGVTMTAPDTVFLSIDTHFGRDVVVEPYVIFGPEVVVDDGALIRSFSHLTGAHIGADAIIGPYARLRPGADIGAQSHVGNFVEVKQATLGVGAKANHLAYIGDADVGAGTNVGAGAITCNYDGSAKHRTVIGAHAFVGTNASLVAPVTIGDGAYIGSGSVITADVPADALALGRGRQVVKEGWAKTLPSRHAPGKE